MKITNIGAREIFDSRGVPTIECMITLENGYSVTSSIPSGISCSAYEAIELRDGSDRLMGLGVRNAVKNIKNIISPMLVGMEPNIIQIDSELLALDGTDNKAKLGANAILAVSIATCKAQAYCEGTTIYDLIATISDFDGIGLPCPMFNLFGGGLHATNNTIIQEYLVIPVAARSFSEAVDMGAIIFYTARYLLQKQGKSTAIGYEGEFVPYFEHDTQALDFTMEVIENAGLSSCVMIGLDVAASHFYDTAKGIYRMGTQELLAQDLIAWYEELVSTYPIYSIEDGLRENDWDNWKNMKYALDGRVKLIGDDLFATNPERIWHGIEDTIADGALIKPNQIGTITETLQAIALCKESDWDVVVSHRSGETNDTFIADLSVGAGAEAIKAGGFARGERIAKYNRLLEIEDSLLC